MSDRAIEIVDLLVRHGFVRSYDTIAVHLLVHPDLPGLEVRVGTIYVVAERDGQEVYRELLAQVDTGRLLARLGAR